MHLKLNVSGNNIKTTRFKCLNIPGTGSIKCRIEEKQ